MPNKNETSELLILNDSNSKEIIKELCEERSIDPTVLEDLVIWLHKNQHRDRRRGLTSQFDEIFTNAKYWA